ncbi:MAG: dihydropteroate synthase [Acidothermales bacterium]|jgi:dihydropteroate synthase|nr:dihydropteroate synthase [Acidothermales bacterium]
MTQVAAAYPAVVGLPELDRCRVMGVVNVTPDSFSDGGRFLDTGQAIAQGLALHRAGADIVDVGGESTRPGAGRVPADEERRRVLPVVRELAAAGATVSVDTMRPGVAEEALAAGARIVNDVSGGRADPALPRLVAAAGVPYVVMHWRGHSDSMQHKAAYGDVVAEVRAELRTRLDEVTAAGVRPEQVVLDPGLGFAKTADHNWALLAGLDDLAALGRPLLVGASRKSFLGRLLAAPQGDDRPTDDRAAGTVAISALAALRGVWCVRVHEVAASIDAVRVAAAWRSAEGVRR